MALPPPPPPHGRQGDGEDPTHVLSAGAGGRYVFGVFDRRSEHFHITGSSVIDAGRLGWTTAGHADDGRGTRRFFVFLGFREGFFYPCSGALRLG